MYGCYVFFHFLVLYFVCYYIEGTMTNTLNQLQRAKEIMDRYVERGRILPRELRDCGRSDPVRQQGYFHNTFNHISFLFEL